MQPSHKVSPLTNAAVFFFPALLLVAAALIGGCDQDAGGKNKVTTAQPQEQKVADNSKVNERGNVTNIYNVNGDWNGADKTADGNTSRARAAASQPARNMKTADGSQLEYTDAQRVQNANISQTNGSSTVERTTNGPGFTGGAQTAGTTMTANPTQTPTVTTSAAIPVAVGAMPQANAQSTAAGGGAGSTPTASGAPTTANKQDTLQPPVPASQPIKSPGT